METKDILKWWNIPKTTIINKNLPKTQIFSHMKNIKDKQFLTDSVRSIYMLANFRTDNTHISTFESDKELYMEIWFYYVKTKGEGFSEKIFRILAELIPYPIIVLVEESENFMIYTGRFERQINDYLKLNKIYPSPVYKIKEAESVIEKLKLSELPRQNFKDFYNALRDEITRQLAIEQYGEEASDINTDVKDHLDEIDKQIKILKNQIKREKQLNRKVEMQMQLKNLKDELQYLIEL